MNDLTIFVLTYNRADMLSDALASIVSQTEKGFRTVILDNASTDHTRRVAQRYERSGVEYLGTGDAGNKGPKWNFDRAISMAASNWTMLFHDDDLIHPNYIQYALTALNCQHDAVLCCSFYTMGITLPEHWPPAEPTCVSGKARDLANLLYAGYPIAFCSAIYKTEWIKRLPVPIERFGKFADRPWLLDITSRGKVLIFQTPMIFSRKHLGQDTLTRSTNPIADKTLALHEYYRVILGANVFSRYGRGFVKHNLFQVLFMYYKHRPNEPINIVAYIIKGLRTGAIAWPTLILGVPYLIYRVLKHLGKYLPANKC